MSSTNSLQDVLTQARRKFLASSFLSPLIGTDIGSDLLDPTIYSGGFNDGWVFYGVGDEATPERDPSNTGTSAVTMNLRRSWSSPNNHNTADFRQLQFSIYSDQMRPGPNSTGLLGKRDAEDRCYRIASAIKREFNDVSNRSDWWGDLYMISCLLYSDVQITDVYGKDGLVKGDIRFALILG